jgi:hypothetical protein
MHNRLSLLQAIRYINLELQGLYKYHQLCLHYNFHYRHLIDNSISVSPYTWNLLSDEIKDTATSKNINIVLLEGNYIEDKRFEQYATKDYVNSEINELTYGVATLEDIDNLFV